MTKVSAIKQFFEKADKYAPDGGRKVEMSELQKLSSEERLHLAELAAKELGVTLD